MAESKTTFNIFVTGGSESAGLATVKALLGRGHQVAAATDDAEGALAIRQTGALPVYPDLTREGEVLSSLRMANAEALVHAAPQIFGGPPQADFADAACLVQSSQTVLRAAKEHGLRQVIVISFAYLYQADHGEAAAEGSPDVHGSDYEPMLAAEAAWLDSGLNVSVIRAGYIYGGRSMATDALAQRIKQSRPLQDGPRPASWIHEDDLATAIAALIEADDGQARAEIINVAADKPQSPNDFASGLSHALGLDAPSLAKPGLMARLRSESRRDKLLKREIVIDSGKIKGKYGWQARYADVAQGLEATTLVWRMREASDPADFYNVYEDKAAAAIADFKHERVLPAPITEEKPPAEVVEKAVPSKASAPPSSDGPTPWNEDEAKREERRRRALERKAKRAAKRAAGG